MIKKTLNWLNDNHFQLTISNKGIYIKDYTQLLEIEDEYVLIRIKDKYISIRGHDIFLIKILDKELLLDGTINKIEVLDEK